MATVRRTTKDYLDYMSHALGKTPDSRHKLIHDLNDAGRALVNTHPWNWRARSGVPLNLVADQSYVELPENFGEIIDIQVDNAQTFTVIQTSLADLNRRRAWGQYDALSLFIAFQDGTEGETDEDGVLENRAQVFPTPTTSRSDINLSYLVKWVDLDESDPDRVPNIPRDWERSLNLFARAFAHDIENRSDPFENSTLFGPTGEMQRLIMLDAGKQVNQGRPLHNVLSRGRDVYYPHRRISR